MILKTILFIYLAMLTFNVTADEICYRVCETWDTFCKSPEQIVATKCRLGVPVYHEACSALGIPKHYTIRGGGDLVQPMPCTNEKKGEL